MKWHCKECGRFSLKLNKEEECPECARKDDTLKSCFTRLSYVTPTARNWYRQTDFDVLRLSVIFPRPALRGQREIPVPIKTTP
jgi:hypothetical protein